MSIALSNTTSVPAQTLERLQEDVLLPICKACGTQYSYPRSSCIICDDPRQFVPPSGQAWTNLAELGSTFKQSLLPDQDDNRIHHVVTEPGFAINQTPFLIETAEGSYIWECTAFLSVELIGYLTQLKKPLRAIAISHPHFFTTSLTWSRALNIPLYICADDREWYQRLDDIKETDDVRFWTQQVQLGKGVKLIQCGGHFPGSSVLYWDRLAEPAPSPNHLPTKPVPVSGILFTSDTIMVQPTQKGFAFLWSVPNCIPLRPKAVLAIQQKLKGVQYSQATSSWPGRWIRQDAKQVFEESVVTHLSAQGWRIEGDELLKDYAQ
ncbi:hypothetical protein L204_100914 [Cryptococcus depauperatus]|nr:hydrolase [Cryptococcus depauperatus CBS 7855]